MTNQEYWTKQATAPPVEYSAGGLLEPQDLDRWHDDGGRTMFASLEETRA